MINIKPPVGRVALIPTQAQTTNKFNRSNKNQYANIFDFIEAFSFANICRDRGNPTYGFFEAFRRNFHFIQCLFNGAMAIAPYGFWRK